jgi:uncharacterized OsmC-like protein
MRRVARMPRTRIGAVTEIGDAIRGARAYLTDHPDEARYTDSAATARLDSGLRVTVEGPDGAAFTTDMPTSIGGGAGAPSSAWFMRAGHAACVATLIAMRAAEEGIELHRLEVTVDSESDDRGILGATDDVPAGPLGSRVRITLEATPPDEARLRDVAEWGWRHCPVDDAMRRAVPVSVEITTG